MGFLFYFLMCFFAYLVFTAGTGSDFFLWPMEEIWVSLVISLLFSAVAYRILPRKVTWHILNPVLWFLGVFYLVGPFLISLIIANFEVMYRILSGRIKPAIVKVETGLKNEAGAYLLANTITLSPGTLTIAMEEDTHDMYIHCLNWEKEKGDKATPRDVSGVLHFFVKRFFG
ncbi:MAG: cation:proton antiporter [bacterium]|nr:cation:proton antiporter [bacterium]